MLLESWEKGVVGVLIFRPENDLNMELPRNNEISHLDVITTGVESEEVEEVNDAYKDILEELGEHEHWTIYNH